MGHGLRYGVVVARLPEVILLTLEMAGSSLLEGLQKLRYEDAGRFVHEQMNVLRHEDVGVDSGLMTGSGLFKDCLNEILCSRVGKIRQAVKATEGDEVEGLGLLITMETVRHGNIVPRTPCPIHRGGFPMGGWSGDGSSLP